MKKLLSLAGLVLLVIAGLGQSAIQRTMLTTNTVPAGVNGQVLVLVSGVPRWSTNAGSLSLSNVTVFGTLTVSTQLVINGTGAGTIQLYATNGTSIVTISSADSFTSYTLYLPTGIQTNAVLQSTVDGHLYWSTDPVLNSVEVTGSGAGYLLIGDASTTNTFKLVGPAAFGSSFTNLWPESPGTNGQVLTMGTNGQWYFGTPGSSGGDQVWTNDAGAIYPLALATNYLVIRDDNILANLHVGSGGSPPAFDDSYGIKSLIDVDSTTNSVRLLWDNAGQRGVYGKSDGGWVSPSGQGVGVMGVNQNSTTNLNYGTIGLVFMSTAGSTNVGVAGVASGLASQTVGGFFGVADAFNSDPQMESSVLLLDNFDSALPILVARKNGVRVGALDANGSLNVVSTVESVSALTWSATTTISVLPTETNYRTLTLGGDTVFAAGDQAAGRWFTCFVTGAATNCAVSFPSWHFMNSAAPTTLAAGKVASLTVFFTDGTDAAAVANYAVEP